MTASGEAPHPLRFRIGFGLLGGMAAWALHLGVSYFAVPWVCARDAGGVLHALTVAAGALAAAATWAAWSAWRRMEEGPPAPEVFDPEVAVRETEPGPEGVALAGRGGALGPFLALSGLVLSGFFLALILLEGLPVLLQADPCMHIPTPDRLIIFHRAETVHGP